jgi:hypothetical protein
MSVQHFDGSVANLERLEDDVRAIRKKCKTPDLWQEQILKSLRDSGWNYSMLAWLPISHPRHWIELLSKTRWDAILSYDPSFERANVASDCAHSMCGSDREMWFELALIELEARGWSRTMLAESFNEPRTNVIRRLERRRVTRDPYRPGLISSPEASDD